MTDTKVREIDTGTAYGLKPRSYKENLVPVGPGTPMGELMRRYWQPCFLSADLTSDKPHKVRILGEDLVLFRDKEGRPGLVHENCCHRGASLYYGRIEEDGIRCCYHGWKFDVKGNCLEQPAEVGGGRNLARFRQPWYPVEERYGLVYTYMGPPEKKPVLPRWAHLENLEPDEHIEAIARGMGPISGERYNPQQFNWLQAFENSMDGPHVPWLHYHHSGDQFTGSPLMRTEDGEPALPPYAIIKDFAGKIIAERSAFGVKQGVPLPVEGQGVMLARNECMVPNMIVVAMLIDLIYLVPQDDTSAVPFLLIKVKEGRPKFSLDEMHGDRTWYELNDEERRDSPGDYEAQSSIGKLPAHNYEHLSHGDIAIALLRRRLEEAVQDVAEGRDPPGIVFDENAPPLEIEAHGMVPFQADAA